MLESLVRFTLTFVGIFIFLVFACWYFPENGWLSATRWGHDH